MKISLIEVRMGNKNHARKLKPAIGNLADPHSLYRHLLNYLENLAVNQRSPHTIVHIEECLRRFLRWCVERDLQTPQQINRDSIERYKKHFFYHRKHNGKPLSGATQRYLIGTVRGFFRYLAKQRIILFNPLAEIDMPKEQQRLPRDILSPKEITLLLSQPAVDSPFGLRDRTIMETMYSTGIRRLECVSLQIRDLDMNRDTLFIREGKGGKDRVVPLGARAIGWLERYLKEVRPRHAYREDSQYLFLTQYGKPLSASYLSDQVTRYLKKTQLSKDGSSHLFRHAMATHMLDNGADIRYIQAILGHSDLSTTEIYTHVSIAQLKKVHRQTHPAQRTRQTTTES